MRQALHIFRKDARHLRWEIALLLVTIFLFAWSEAAIQFAPFTVLGSGGYFQSQSGRQLENWVKQVSEFLVVVIALVLAGRLAHSEALPGDRQFWLTRPYAWKSLLGAKCLFLLAFVIVPMTMSDVALLEAAGFRGTDYLPGLLWEQILRTAVVVAPALALAAVTRTTASQIFSAVGLAVLWFACYGSAYGDLTGRWTALQWVYDSITTGIVLVCSAAIVVWQYARRRTFASRIVLGCGTALAGLVPLVPPSVALAIQTGGSKKLVEPSAIHVAVDPDVPAEAGSAHWIRLPLRITGVPEGLRMWADQMRIEVELRGADGQMGADLPLQWYQWVVLDSSHALVLMSYPRLPGVDRGPVRLRASGLATLGGNPRRVPTPRLRVGLLSWVAVPGLGQCIGGMLSNCRIPFRRPLGIASGPWSYVPSYSPVPAELAFDPVQTYGTPALEPTSDGLTIEDPVEHFFYDFELDDVRLADYEVGGRKGR